MLFLAVLRESAGMPVPMETALSAASVLAARELRSAHGVAKLGFQSAAPLISVSVGGRNNANQSNTVHKPSGFGTLKLASKVVWLFAVFYSTQQAEVSERE